MNGAVGTVEILRDSAEKDCAAFKGDLQWLPGKFAIQLATNSFKAINGLAGAGTDLDVEELTGAALFPNDEGCVAGCLAVYQDFIATDRDGFGKVAQADGNTFNRLGAIDEHRPADNDNHVVCRVMT